MKLTEFNPKAGSLELSFTDGKSYSLPLAKNYHGQENFYADLFWEEKNSGLTLSLALHPKSENLRISCCRLMWPLVPDTVEEVSRQGFTQALPTAWHKPERNLSPPKFLKKLALKKLNLYDPLPEYWEATASYQSIALRNNQQVVEIKSTDESAALTVFSLSQKEGTLVAENQSEGYHLRHTFPAFELQFQSKKKQRTLRKKVSTKVFSLAVSSSWVEQPALEQLSKTSLIEEGNFKSIILTTHQHACPGQTGFDESLFLAFAKTCHAADVQAGIMLSPFVIAAGGTTIGLNVDRKARFRRWSISLQRWVYPIDIRDEDSRRACEQHLMRFYQMGYRHFILQDVALSLREGFESITTGQQLEQRLGIIKNVLPEASIILGDLSCSQAFDGFSGFRPKITPRARLTPFAKFAGLGDGTPSLGKLARFRIPTITFSPAGVAGAQEIPVLLDLSKRKLDKKTWHSIESTLGDEDYPNKSPFSHYGAQ